MFAEGIAARPAVSQEIPPVTIAKSYHDPSHHRQLFVEVARGVKVEVLDWGGTGPAVLMIPGYGFSAHVYDDLATRLNPRYHILGMTVRGWTPSDAPPTG